MKPKMMPKQPKPMMPKGGKKPACPPGEKGKKPFIPFPKKK